MTRLLTVFAVAALALPAAALAEDPPSPQERANGARVCAQLKQSMGAATFQLTYRNMGACVSKWAHDRSEREEVAEDVQTTLKAAKSCKRDRAADRAAFAAKSGSGANAFGKCVSATARKLEAEAEQSSTG